MSIQYSGLFINFDKVIQVAVQNKIGLDNMSQQVQRLSATCSNMAIGYVPEIDTNDYNPFPPLPEPSASTIRALILIIPFELMNQYASHSNPTTVLQEFERGTPFEASLGHCYITWDKNTNICGIWDVCLHQQTGQGLGSVLTEAIMDTLAMQLPNNTTLWLGIDIRNNSFTKIASLYSKFGFEDPYISFEDPFGNNWAHSVPLGFVALHRSNDYMDPDEIDRESIQADILYLLTQYVKIQGIYNTAPDLTAVQEVSAGVRSGLAKGQQDYCSIHVKFNKSYSRWLSKLPVNASTLNIDGSVTQKEVSGAFWLDDPIRQSDGTFIWEITVDKDRGLNATNEESVDMVIGRYNFHTHTREAYDRHNVLIGYPSGEDYVAFLSAVIYDDTIFHCVITLEGVYTISLNTYWCSRIDELKTLIQQGGSTLSDYITRNFGIAKTIPFGLDAAQAGLHYSNVINQQQLFTDHIPVFQCNFLSWENIFEGVVMEIGYPVLFNQCFATERGLFAIKKFHPEAFS